MSLAATISLALAAAYTKTGDLEAGKTSVNPIFSQQFADGAGAGQANLLFSDRRQLAASGTENIDLAGTLTNLFGEALVFARIKAIVVRALSTNTNDVQVTRPAANGAPLFMAAGDGIALSPGEVFTWFSGTAAGKPVTAGTGDLLTITNSAAGSVIDYEIIIIGAAT